MQIAPRPLTLPRTGSPSLFPGEVSRSLRCGLRVRLTAQSLEVRLISGVSGCGESGASAVMVELTYRRIARRNAYRQSSKLDYTMRIRTTPTRMTTALMVVFGAASAAHAGVITLENTIPVGPLFLQQI